VEPTYTPLGSRSTTAILALYVTIGACLLAVGADARRIVVAQRLEDGRVLVDALLVADQLVTLANRLEVIAFVVAAALFLRWQVAAHRNLPVLGEPTPPAGVGAGVASWFVPVVNLVRPLRVVEDLWRAGKRGEAAPTLLRVWWIAWVVALVAVLAAWMLLGEAVDVAELQRIDGLRAVVGVLSAFAASLAIAVVSQTTTRQEARAVAIGAPRAVPSVEARDESASEGGLRVLSEEQARRSQRDS